MRTSLTSACVVVALAWACAQQALADDLAVVSKYVSERTVVVFRADLTRVNAEALTGWVVESLKHASAPADLVEQAGKSMGVEAKRLQRRADKLKSTGAKSFVFLLNLDSDDGIYPVLIVPGVTQADPAVQLFENLGFEVVKQDADVVATDERHSNSVGQIVASPREELTRALTSPAQYALAAGFSDGAREKLVTDHPVMHLPRNPIQTAVVLDGMQRALVTLDGPPDIGLKVSINSKDDASAEALLTLVDNFLVQNVRDKSITDVIKSLLPKRQGSELTRNMTSADVDHAIASLMPAMLRAREMANRVKSAANIRQLLMGAIMYSNDKDGAVPTKFDDLKPVLGDDEALARLQVNPRRPASAGAGYVFVAPTETKMNQIKDTAERIAIYEAGEFGEGLNVGFWDGHVEFVTDKARFDQFLAGQK